MFSKYLSWHNLLRKCCSDLPTWYPSPSWTPAFQPPLTSWNNNALNQFQSDLGTCENITISKVVAALALPLKCKVIMMMMMMTITSFQQQTVRQTFLRHGDQSSTKTDQNPPKRSDVRMTPFLVIMAALKRWQTTMLFTFFPAKYWPLYLLPLLYR